ncbi:MAG: replication/maintenance protein RepL [Oscillospiraceae bacterium]|nr:replication/maintenance protein RepL [Oscillospiraceae bacterium]
MSSTITVGSSLQNSDCTFEQRQHDIALEEKREEERRKRERHSPYESFAQFNLDPVNGKARRKLMLECPSAFAIFDFLVEKADKYNAVICSPKVFEEALGLSQATVYRAVKVLQEKKFIDIKKSGTSNVYMLNKELVWKSWGTNYRYAEFGAKIILSESEQEKIIKTRRMNVVEVENYGKYDKGSADSDKLEYDESFDDFEAGADRED